MMAVRRVSLPARRVFNLTAPRWLPQARNAWTDAGRDWHGPGAEEARDLVEARYIAAFNRLTGHYRLLEESIRAGGVYNPVMLTTGPLLRRDPMELPPAVRTDPERIVCEYVGGSRLLIAARLGLDVPAIVNDGANLFPEAPQIKFGDPHVNALFRDQPRKVLWNYKNGSLYVNFFEYGHFPKRERVGRRAQQIQIRRKIIGECLAALELHK
jgi:hypothetical protein